jgi:hypothetical protein
MRPEVQHSNCPGVTRERSSQIESICANIVLAGSSIITALILGYYFYYYVWTGSRQFISWRGAAFEIVAPGALSLFFLTSLGMARSCKTKLALSCLAFNVLLLGSERILDRLQIKNASVNSAFPFWGIDKASDESKQVIAKLAQQSGIQFDTRNRLEVSAELRQRGIDAVPAVMIASVLGENNGRRFRDYTKGSYFVPIGAIANKTTILCNESGQYVTYNSDEHGFRNPRGIWKTVRADIAALGESLIQGYCVPDEKPFVDILRKHYPVTLNLGISGESSLLQLAAINEYLPRYAPRTVLWFFCEGIDLDDLQVQAKHSLLKRYLEPGFTQHLFDQQEEIDRALRGFTADLEKDDRSKQIPNRKNSSMVDTLVQLIKLPNLRQKLDLVYGVSNEDAEVLLKPEGATWDVFRSALLRAKSLTNSWGGSLYFVYLPSWNRFGKGVSVPEIEHTRVLKVVNGLDIPTIDVVPAFQAHKDPLSLFTLRVFGHYNELGNQIVSETVLKFLTAREQNASLRP